MTGDVTLELVGAPRVACGLSLPRRPTPVQSAFLLLEDREVFMAGAGGSGKSDALLLAALQWVDVPGYAALILRRTFNQLGEIIDRAEEWLAPSGAVWSATDARWTFPSGAHLEFGHAEQEADRLRYAGDEYQFVAGDELASWPTAKAYLYVGFARVRRPSSSDGLRACPHCGATLADVPLRTRAASNPIGPGVSWVRERFRIAMDGDLPAGRRYLPAVTADNPHLDVDGYFAGLDELDPVEKARMRDGDWTVSEGGTVFERSWLEANRVAPRDVPWSDLEIVRAWDLAATAVTKKNKDPDYTAGCLLGVTTGRTKTAPRGEWFVIRVDRIRATPSKVEQFLYDTHVRDEELLRAHGLNYRAPIRVEIEGGSAGAHTIDQLQRGRFAGIDFAGRRPRVSKGERARPVAVAAEAGHVHLVEGAWNSEFVQECELFGTGFGHDDQVDAWSLAFAELAPSFAMAAFRGSFTVKATGTESGAPFGPPRSPLVAPSRFAGFGVVR
jgi:predicted phage terminase large subunit-like protein